MRGNFLDVPTDCPQRDERLGWTGDIAVFAPTAAYLFDVRTFLRTTGGSTSPPNRPTPTASSPSSSPTPSKYTAAQPSLPRDEATAIWGDAAVWVRLGTLAGLRRPRPASRVLPGQDRPPGPNRDPPLAHRPVGHLLPVRRLTRPRRTTSTPAAAKADPGVVATACLYRSSSLAAQTAQILGQDADAVPFADLAVRTRAAFATGLRRLAPRATITPGPSLDPSGPRADIGDVGRFTDRHATRL